MIDITSQDITVMGLSLVVGGYIVKEYFLGRNKKLDNTVDKNFCDERNNHIQDQLKDIKDTGEKTNRSVDDLKDWLMKGGNK